MGKFLITEWKECILTAFYDGARILSLDLSLPDRRQLLGNIYVARVERVVKNLNAAFLRYGEQERAYCALDRPVTPIFQNRSVDFSGEGARLREGDIVLAQISQEAIKTKEPCARTDLSLAGRYVVLEMNAPKFLNFSKKIRDRKFRAEWEELLAPEAEGQETLREKFSGDLPPFGFILRTNALSASREDILNEINHLTAVFRELAGAGKYRSLYSLVYQEQPGYLREVRDAGRQEVDEVVTDVPSLCGQMQEAFAIYPDLAGKLRLYRDSLLPLSKLYPVEKTVREALGKKVWLKSGGYLMIEQTEACAVIDVNTGKFDAKKEKEATFLKINLEAADEIALQLRLRNLSGMILVDFINMRDPENDELLMQRLRSAVAKDKVPVTVVDMTKLKLVELTRKKEKKPFSQQYSELTAKEISSQEFI
ncbi:MAG: ribonuclease E/G [Lachnospiraceae bacterium]|nr:ribonuclease E/G [Lachnospiraceae bacterium]